MPNEAIISLCGKLLNNVDNYEDRERLGLFASKLAPEEKVMLAKSQFEINENVINLFTIDELLLDSTKEIRDIVLSEKFLNRHFANLSLNLQAGIATIFPEKVSDVSMLDLLIKGDKVTSNLYKELFSRKSFKEDFIANFSENSRKYLKKAFSKKENLQGLIELNKLRNSYIDATIKNKGIDFLIDKFLEDNSIEKDFPYAKAKAVAEIFSIRFGKDSMKNLFLNTETIYNFITTDQSFKNQIGPEKADLISRTYIALKSAFDEVVSENIVVDNLKSLYNEFNDKNISFDEIMYDVLSNAKEQFMQNVVNEETKIDSLASREESDGFEKLDYNVSGVNVYKFKGDKFLFPVHCSYDKDEYIARSYKEDWIEYAEKNQLISISLINQNRMTIFDEDRICFAFSDLNPKLLTHAAVVDSYSTYYMPEDNTPISKTRIDLKPVEQFINETGNGVNELVYAGSKEFSKETLLPSAIISFSDKISRNEIKAAQEFKIPIVIIDKNCYKFTPESQRVPLEERYSLNDL